MTQNRDKKTGQFVRTRQAWNQDKWDDGYIDSRGRFRVYRPDCPRAYRGGYALRSHVVWWLHQGKCHPQGTALHHKNGIKTDDEIENLEVVLFGEHTRNHCIRKGVALICETCSQKYYLPAWRIRQKEKEGYKPKFCSRECFYNRCVTAENKASVSAGPRKAYRNGKR